MDDLLEILTIPLDVYLEYFAGLGFLLEEWPGLVWAYMLIAPPLAGWLIHLLSRKALTFRRTYLQCAVLALMLLPGVVGYGAMLIAPLALLPAVAVVFVLGLDVPTPWLLLLSVPIYNSALLLIAAFIAWAAAVPMHAWLVRTKETSI